MSKIISEESKELILKCEDNDGDEFRLSFRKADLTIEITARHTSEVLINKDTAISLARRILKFYGAKP